MKGIVFNLLQEIVIDKFGEDAWDDLIEAADVGGSYTSLGNYEDAELIKLVGAASDALSMPPNDVVRFVGREALPKMAERFAPFFEPHQTTRSFVLTLNDIIHPEVRKLYPGADVPDFVFDNTDPKVLVMQYNSRRRLCAFAMGLIEGAATHYGETVAITEQQCMLQGADSCVLDLRFAPLAKAA